MGFFVEVGPYESLQNSRCRLCERPIKIGQSAVKIKIDAFTDQIIIKNSNYLIDNTKKNPLRFMRRTLHWHCLKKRLQSWEIDTDSIKRWNIKDPIYCPEILDKRTYKGILAGSDFGRIHKARHAAVAMKSRLKWERNQLVTTPEYLAGMLTSLAEQVPEGSCIVELGTYHGKGAIALAQGVRLSGRDVEVITVDDYQEKKGWIGEIYVPEDAQVFYENVRKAGVHVTHSRMNFDDAATMWTRSIGLLYWDPGCVDRFENDWNKWSPFVIPGGVFIAKDTAQGHLGTFPVIEQALEQGWEKFNYWQGVSFLRRLHGND